MAFRDDISALAARHDALERELSEVRQSKRELEGLDAREKALERELQESTAQLVGMRGASRRRLGLLDEVRIASPCHASWEDMVGDDRVRFCRQCEKSVYNLSAMPRDEAEELLRSREGLCVRLSRRRDGTVISGDCPVGMRIRRAQRRKFALVAVGGGLLATWTGAFAFAPKDTAPPAQHEATYVQLKGAPPRPPRPMRQAPVGRHSMGGIRGPR